MSFSPVWIIFATVLLGAFVGYLAAIQIRRKQACFAMYAVRDRFVLLVAEGTVPETSRVFRYHYRRINHLLQKAPKVGLDDVLTTISKQLTGPEFETALKKVREEAQEIASDPLMKDEHVRAAIAEYYAALRGMILAHSSLLNLLYLGSKLFLARACEKALSRLAPSAILGGLGAVKLAEREVREFSGSECHAG